MKIELSRNEFDLVRAITANRLTELMESATDVNLTGSDRERSLDHASRVGLALIRLDESDVDG
jgi:hypothetical protein